MDGCYEINGRKYIVDYKTSNHVTFRYFLQIAAYRYILREELTNNVLFNRFYKLCNIFLNKKEYHIRNI